MLYCDDALLIFLEQLNAAQSRNRPSMHPAYFEVLQQSVPVDSCRL